MNKKTAALAALPIAVLPLTAAACPPPVVSTVYTQCLTDAVGGPSKTLINTPCPPKGWLVVDPLFGGALRQFFPCGEAIANRLPDDECVYGGFRREFLAIQPDGSVTVRHAVWVEGPIWMVEDGDVVATSVQGHPYRDRTFNI